MKFYKETTIGIIVTLIIACFIWGLNFLKGRNFFSTTKEYYAVFDNIGGLKKSSPVSANGYTIGRVSDIEFMTGNIHKIIVEISVERQFLIPKNSTIQIYNSDLMGSKAVNLIMGDSQTVAADNDTLTPQFEEDLSSLLARQIMPLKQKAEHLIVSIDTVMSSLKYTLNRQTQNNFHSIVANLDDLLITQREKVSTILDNLQSVSENLKKNNQHISGILGNVSSLSDSIKASKLKTAINEAATALTNINELLVKVNSGQGSLGKIVNSDSIYNSLNVTIYHLDSLILDLNKNPSRYIHFSLFGKKDSQKEKK